MAGVTVAVASTLGSIWTQSPTTGTLYEFMLIAALTAIGGALGKNTNLIYAVLFYFMYYSISYNIIFCPVMLCYTAPAYASYHFVTCYGISHDLMTGYDSVRA